MDRSRPLLYRLHLDGPLMVALLMVCVIGFFVIYSAGGESLDMVARQGLRVGIGFALMIALAQVSPETIGRWSPWLYALGLVLLVAVAVFGEGRGAQRWLDLGVVRFQPSEMMKIVVPLLAAWYLCDKTLPPSFARAALALLLIAIPVVLVEEQPDLGTAALIGIAGVFVLFLAGMRWSIIASAVVIALVALPLLWFNMHDYQQERVLTFLDPEQDPLGAGYHIIQSKIAVGSGGVFGKGWLNGTQSHLEFLPERHTDFIFAVFCEEFGLMGVLVLMGLYAFIVFRGLQIAAGAQETFGRLIAGSLTLTFFVYVFINMGMVIGQVPVVGVPLPLVSYGGTSMVTLLAGFGILMGVHTHRRLLSD